MEEIAPQVEQEKALLSWIGLSRPYKGRTKQILTVPVVIGILVGIILIFAGEWMLIGVVAALIFAYYMWSTVKPDDTEYKITTRGIRAHGRLYMWDVLTRWWIEEKWAQKMLMVETPVNAAGRIVMPLGETKDGDVEKVMEKFLLKEAPEPTQLDKMGKWLAEKFPLEEKI
jgi:hypothetical protein